MTMSLLTDITHSKSTFDDSFYKNWRRQKKIYEIKIKSLNENLKQMQEKLNSLQQKQLQGDLARGRNAINKSKFNKFDHINMEIILGFCKNKMFPIYKFLEQSMLIFLSNEWSQCAKLTRLIQIPRGIEHSHWLWVLLDKQHSANDQREVHWNMVEFQYGGEKSIPWWVPYNSLVLIKMDLLTYSCTHNENTSRVGLWRPE